MKPRSKIDLRILDISKSLGNPINDDVKVWALKTCFDCKGIECKGEIYCFNCNKLFMANNLLPGSKCPCCSAKLKVEKSKRKKYNQEMYFSIIDFKDNYQIVRHFLIVRSIHIGRLINDVHIWPICENYIDVDKFDIRTISRTLHQGWRYMSIPFNVQSDMYLRPFSNEFHMVSGYVHPKGRIHPFYENRGVKSNLHNIQPDKLFRELRGNSQIETLMKSKMYDFVDKIISNTYMLSRYWPQVKIAIRHKYKIKEVKMWFDHLEILQRNRKDIRNPKYILPANLKKEHQKLIDLDNKRRAINDAKIKRLRDIREAKEAEEAMKRYLEEKGKFFNFHIEKGNLSIDVIRSLVEMAEEGSEMKHCVYSARYYNSNCLILSVKASGERLATIELSLEDWNIKQVRGKCNSRVDEDPLIRELIQSNLKQLIKLNEAS